LLYGTTSQGGDANCDCGVICSFNPEPGVEQVFYHFQRGTDGNDTIGDLAVPGSTLYGTTFLGGTPGGFGTAYGFDPATKTETVPLDDSV
jgi:uncharacterized repeat protein (TIGR03803 family)